jgi:hypothetical protein
MSASEDEMTTEIAQETVDDFVAVSTFAFRS